MSFKKRIKIINKNGGINGSVSNQKIAQIKI